MLKYFLNVLDLSESIRESRPPRRRTHSTGHSKKEAEYLRSVSSYNAVDTELYKTIICYLKMPSKNNKIYLCTAEGETKPLGYYGPRFTGQKS